MRGFYLIVIILSFLGELTPLRSETAEKLMDSLINKENQNIQNWTRNKTIWNLSTCSYRIKEKISTVSYIELACQKGSWSQFIHFGSKNQLMNANFFRIEGWRSIGNKKYLEIVFVEDINPSGKEPAISQSNKIKKLDKKAKTEISNLNVFLDLYKSNTKEIKWETGMEIFFNSECPLRYVGYNHDYYWDKKVFHSFEVSCLLDSNKPLVIYLEGNSLGELPLNNKWSTNLDKDSLYLVRVILENWKGERIVWKDPLLYTYED